MFELICLLILFAICFSILYCLAAIFYLFKLNGVTEKMMIDYYKNERKNEK